MQAERDRDRRTVRRLSHAWRRPVRLRDHNRTPDGRRSRGVDLQWFPIHNRSAKWWKASHPSPGRTRGSCRSLTRLGNSGTPLVLGLGLFQKLGAADWPPAASFFIGGPFNLSPSNTRVSASAWTGARDFLGASVDAFHFEFVPISPALGLDLAKVLSDSIRDRISRGINANDQPATALRKAYANREIRPGARPIRDWRLTGRTMNALQPVPRSDGNLAVGFNDARASQIAAINNAHEKMFGVSPSDRRVFIAALNAFLYRRGSNQRRKLFSA